MAKIINSYFPHDSNARSDRKILKLRRIHGWAGYGIYFALIEILREQPDFKYPLSQISELEYELRESKEIITSIITNFGLFNIDEQKNFFSISLVARLQPFLERSKRAIEANRIRWGNAKTSLNQKKSIQMDIQMDNQMESVSESKENRIKDTTLDEVKNTWNFFANSYGLSEIIKISKSRKSKIIARLKNKDFDLVEILKAAEPQSFLFGDSKGGWAMDFDWLFANDKNYIKILEKKYKRKNGQNGGSGATIQQLAKIAADWD